MNTSELVKNYEEAENIGHGNIIVVCSADDNYAMQVAVTGRSAIENLKNDSRMVLYIIDGGIKEHNKKKILKSLKSEKCEVKFLSMYKSLLGDDIEDINRSLGPDGKTIAQYISIAAFFRILIPDLLPVEIEKVIYLDCDLVVRGDLTELWKLKLGENHILAAQDTWIRFVSSTNGLLNYRELGLSPNFKYFNSGVLVINLKKWRETGTCKEAMNYLRQSKTFIRWHDQDVLNAVLAGKWGELNPKWNFNTTSFYDYASKCYLRWKESESLFSKDIYDDLIRNPSIVHFASEKKPWISRHTPRKEDFFEYVDMTEWAGWRLTIWRRLWRRLVREFKATTRKS